MPGYLNAGINIISDHIFWSWDWVCWAMESLRDYQVLMVKLWVEDDVGDQREFNRGRGTNEEDAEKNNRPDGHYRGSAKVTHQGIIYDYCVDATHKSVEEVANEIKTAFYHIKKPSALDRMRKKYYQEMTATWLNPR